MVVSLSSLQNDSVPDKVEVTKFNLPADILLLLDLAHGPESDAGHTLWVKMQNYAKNRGTVYYSINGSKSYLIVLYCTTGSIGLQCKNVLVHMRDSQLKSKM